jgi:hypothetical protein
VAEIGLLWGYPVTGWHRNIWAVECFTAWGGVAIYDVAAIDWRGPNAAKNQITSV